jgi:hypothetical protein
LHVKPVPLIDNRYMINDQAATAGLSSSLACVQRPIQ